MRPIRALLPAALAFSLLLTACGEDKPAAPDSLLGYIPADTPYAFANREVIPRGHIDAWMQKFEPLMPMYEGMIDDTLKLLAGKAAPELADRVVIALLEEMKGNVSLVGLEKIGFDRQMRFAMYGVGLVPVMRVELKDEAAFRAFIARIEGRVGEKLPEASAGELEYWKVGKADEKVAGLLAIADGDVVFSVMPANASQELIERLVGVTRPEKTLLDDDKLAALEQRLGLSAYGSGYVDTVRLFETLLGERSAIEQEFVAALGATPPQVTPECRSELMGIAAKIPRLAVGYTRLEPTAMDTRFLVELEPGLAAQLKGIGAPVPGLGATTSGLVSFGLSFDIGKLNQFIGAQASAVAAAPFQCEELAELNKTFADMQTQLANPMVFAAAPVFKGLNASLTKFSMSPMPDVSGKFLIASDDPKALVAFAGQMVPQISALNLQAGAAPVPLPAELAPPGTPPTHVALGDKAIGFSIGAGEEAGLQAFMAAPAGDPAPILAIGYSGEFFATIADGMEMQAASLEEQERKELERAVGPMRDVYGKAIERIDTSVAFTDAGIEMRQTMTLR